MNTFSFVIHPVALKRDAARKFPIFKFFPESLIEALALKMGPQYVSHIQGIESLTGAKADGHFIGCPLSARQLVHLPEELVYKKLVDCGKMSADKGAKVMGLGAFTSVAGDAGITVAKRLEGIINVTSGNSYTIYTAVEGLLKAAELMGIDVKKSNVAIVGATGSIGAVCSKMLAPDVAQMSLVGRDMEKLEQLQSDIQHLNTNVKATNDIRGALREADLVLAVSAAGKELVFPEDLKSGAVVCDVARPRDVSKSVVEKRNDVLVIEGGVIEVPGVNAQFNFDFGFPEKTAFACMSETMMLALEGTFESFTLGRDLDVNKVLKTGELAKKHGFKLAGFRAFEVSVTDEKIAEVRANAAPQRSKIMI
jgi:fatty aldehyde-generating acyl-ACP reductase